MGTAHFITAATGNAGVVALCGEVFTTKQKQQMGVYGQICSECEKRVKNAWVTFK